MIKAGGLWGLGIHGTHFFLQSHGIDYDLHNTYMRMLCECGILVGCVFIVLSIKLLKSIWLDIKRAKDLKDLCFPLILLSGLLSGLWEPQVAVGTVNWWSLWWFILGTYISLKKYNRKAQSYSIDYNRKE